MKAPKPESNFEPLAEGSYSARLYSIVEIGTESGEYQGKKISSKKVRLTFELPTELKEFREGEGEKPFAISREFTFSMHPKSNLRPFIESWIGNFKSDDAAYDFDIDDLIGKTGLASLTHHAVKDRIYLNLSAIVPLPKGMFCPEPFNTPYTLYYENWDQAAYDIQPEYIKNRMADTPEFKAMNGESFDEEEEIDIEQIN